jgi:hypothetical protein
MARQQHTGDDSWPRAEELFRQGDPAFVDEVRRATDAERLGKFAATWYADKRPGARRLLLEYLDRPLNAVRHEALVKRLFKRAEAAGDDEVMGRFLVLFDRSVRRVARTVRHVRSKQVKTREAAKKLAAQWKAEGWKGVSVSTVAHSTKRGLVRVFYLRGMRQEEAFQVPPGTTMWRPAERDRKKRLVPPTEKQRLKWEERCRLFTPRTRNYLRRRAWRYFRNLGKQHPERYLPAVSAALICYQDADVATGLALLDNWGLMHALFHHSPALVARANGWKLAADHTLAELAPAPIYGELWKAAPRVLIGLLKGARCRPVRQWAVGLLRRDHAEVLNSLTLEELVDLLGSEDPDVVALAAEVIRARPELDALAVERWLGLLERANPQALDVLCELAEARLHPERVTLGQAVGLAASRPLPLAQLGFRWLRTRQPQSEEDYRLLLGLTEAQAEPLRVQLVRWARGLLATGPYLRPDWVLEFLDSRHRDVRAEGWRWLREEPRASENVDLWQRLLESPYDDVRLLLVADLEDRLARADSGRAEAAPLDSELVRLLWASVLLNVHRGGRSKPFVVRQLVRRLEHKPNEAAALLPMLAVALRSVRGPEWRAGLAGVVQLAEKKPSLRAAIEAAFPELELAEAK